MTHLPGVLESSHRVPGFAGRCANANPEAAQDAELVRRFNGGDAIAFDEIVTRYRGKMFAVGFSLLRNHADAEEIAQETFIRAHRGLALFRGESSLATWLHRIATNVSRNRYWYLNRRRQHEIGSLDCAFGDKGKMPLADFIASVAPNPAREAVNREFIDRVTVCMGRLSPNQREILRLRNLLNCSYGEIARRLGITVGTVKSRIARARVNLRGLLAGAYGLGEHDTSLSFRWFEPNWSSSHMARADR